MHLQFLWTSRLEVKSVNLEKHEQKFDFNFHSTECKVIKYHWGRTLFSLINIRVSLFYSAAVKNQLFFPLFLVKPGIQVYVSINFRFVNLFSYSCEVTQVWKWQNMPHPAFFFFFFITSKLSMKLSVRMCQHIRLRTRTNVMYIWHLFSGELWKCLNT